MPSLKSLKSQEMQVKRRQTDKTPHKKNDDDERNNNDNDTKCV